MKLKEQLQENRITNIIIVFLFLQPVIDLLTSSGIILGFPISIGAIIRSLFLVFAIYYVLFKHNMEAKHRKLSIIYMTCLAVYIVLHILNLAIYKDITQHLFGIELKMLIKSFYFPLMFFVLFNLLNKKSQIDKTDLVLKVGAVYVLIILIAYFTGTSALTYGGNKIGVSGWFFSPNELSAILGIITPFGVMYLIKNRITMFKWLLALLLVIVMLMVGTKVPMMALYISFIAVIVYLFANSIITKSKVLLKKKVMPIAILLIVSILLTPVMPIGYNLASQLKWLNVYSVFDLAHYGKINELNNMIYSNRDIYKEQMKQRYDSANLKDRLIGLGYTKVESLNEETNKTVEMDYFDIFYRYGIIGNIIYWLFYIVIMLQTIKEIFKTKLKMIFENIEIFSLGLSMALALLIAYFAGHVLTAPAVSIYVSFLSVVLYVNVYDSKKK